jgi:hypothetical protein
VPVELLMIREAEKKFQEFLKISKPYLPRKTLKCPDRYT